MRVIALATHTFKEALRMKILFLVALISFLLIILSPLIPSFDVGVRKPLFDNISFSLAYLTSLGIAIVLSAIQIPREIEKRTIFNIISKPIYRWEFVAGKLLGITITTLCVLFALFTPIFVLSIINFHILDWVVFEVMLAYLAEITVICSISIFFSIFLSPIVNGSLTLLAYLAFHIKSSALLKISAATSLPLKLPALLLYYLLPNLENFNISDGVAHGVPVDPLNIVSFSLYAVAFAVGFALLACAFFSKKEIG